MKKTVCVIFSLLLALLTVSCSAGDGTDNSPDTSTGSETDTEATSETEISDPLSLFDKICDADTALRLSVGSNAVVIEQKGCTSGQETWDAFIDSVDKKLPASVLCSFCYPGRFTDNGQAKCFFYQLEYDGNEYKISIRESSSGEIETSTEYKHLLHYTGDAPTPDALYSSYEFYVLTDDPNVTWEEIFRGTASSQIGDMLKHHIVYINYSGWKGN